jgi:hypothetical protein
MNYEKQYLIYKSKYKKLKKLIGGEDLVKSTLIEKLKDKDNYFELEDLDINDYNKIDGEIDIPDEKGNLPIQLYVELEGSNQEILEFLLPSKELYTHQNNRGDTILQTAGKILNNEEVIVYLWSNGFNVAKNIKNIDGLNLLELTQKLFLSNSNFSNQLDIVSQLYDENLEESIKQLFEDKNNLSIFNKVNNIREINYKKVNISKIEKKLNISNRSIRDLLNEFDQDFINKKELFIYGLKDLNEAIDFGLSFKCIYVDKSSLSKVPIEPDQISEVNIIDFNNDKLRNYLSTMDGIIGVIKETDKESFDAFKNKE